ncbi:MAG: AsmA-like C-terminal region-containing protein [Gallionella sp.]|nr:AsmA-like C-terminal region-containing protein [Gallionella sp.]
MDSNTIFIKTGKGEDEMRNKSAHLVGDIRRALLMVDGTATFGEISKRAAPSLRSVLDEMFKELEKGGFIQDKAKAKAKAGNIPKMGAPLKMATPLKKPVDEGVEELDFTAAFRAPSADMLAVEAKKAEAAKLKMADEAKAHAEAEAKAKREIEAAKLKAQEEAARQKAEQEAARARAELEAAKAKAEAEARAEAKARQEIEAAKLKAQQEAEEARLKAEREAAKAREEAERRAREDAEAARVKAEQEAARVRAELEAAKAKAEAEAKARAEAEAKARQEIEAAKLKAQQEAEEARLRAEREAAKAREEAERRAKEEAEAEAKAREEAERRAREEAEAVRVKAEQEAARVRAELETANAKADAEAKAREEAERRSQKEAEAAKLEAQKEAEARLKAEQEAAKAREEAELARQQAAAREEAEQRNKQEAEAALKVRQEAETTKPKTAAYQAARSTSATVLFFDVVGYTKQTVNKQIEIKKQFNQLVTDCLEARGDDEHIILDTGDGAAIGFLQHPEDALEVAMQFRKTVMANQHQDYPDLKVRIGIHLGPVNVAKDMNGRSNMVGDGINDAQRVMSFAGIDQVYISRAYYDFVSRLSDEYDNLFQYRGLQKDKHGREHPVYELMDAAAPVAEAELLQAGEPAVTIKLEPFSFAMPEAATPPAPTVAQEEPEPEQQDIAALMGGIEQFKLPEETQKPVEAAQAIQQQPPSASVPETPPSETPAKPVAEARMPSAEEVAKHAETQAKAWAEAEQRAAKAGAERAAQPQEAPRPVKETPAARARRKPLPLGKIGAGLFVALVIALFAVPPLLPMKDYATGIEKALTASLQQPVHVGQLAGRLLPTPRLELKDVSIGETKPIQVQQARVDFALSALFSSNKPITGIELDGVQVNGAALPQVSAWLQKIAADTQYPVARIGLSQGKLEADGVQLSGISGELSFSQAGKFTQAKLHADGNKLTLDINATPENKMQISIAVRGSALPLLPNWVFDNLDAKGELTGDGLVITALDGSIMGGMLLGDARIDWRTGWRAQGNLVAKTITLQNMSKALSGDMDGTARFQMQSASLSKLVEAATLEGAFAVKKGVINGVDVVETARLRSRESLPGGRTHFDELSGNLYYANGDYHFRQVKMSAGVLNATGTLDIAKQQVSGRVIADLTMRAGMGSVALQVGGTTDNPSLQMAR